MSLELYKTLLLKLAFIIELANDPDNNSHKKKQAILQATNDFRQDLAHAREFANNLPGGRLLTEEQQDIINVLVGMRDSKIETLAKFAQDIETLSASQSVQMEIDSTASTPFGQ